MTEFDALQALGVPVLDGKSRATDAVEKLGSALARLRAASGKTDTSPTAAQKESGRYKKGRFYWKGLTVVIETPKGAVRSGVGKDGTAWSVKMRDHYGYVEGTEGRDGDAVDVFLCEDALDSELVFVVNQRTAAGGFDEHKVVLGCTNLDQAKTAYLRNYSPGWAGMGEVTPITLPHFKWWLEHADTRKEVKNGYFAAKENLKPEKRGSANPIAGPTYVRIKVPGDKAYLLHHYLDAAEYDHPSGRVEEGEDYRTAAIRELRERVGYEPNRPEDMGEHLVDGDFAEFTVPYHNLRQVAKPGELGGYATDTIFGQPHKITPAVKTASDLGVTVDRPKGFKKTFHTKAGPKELEYPLDYGYFPGVVNPEDNEDADVFVGTGGPLHGRFMKGKPGPNGAMVPDERKWYAGLHPHEYDALKNWWESQHDAGLTWDWTDLVDQHGLLADVGVTPAKTAASDPDEQETFDRADDETALEQAMAKPEYLNRYKCPNCGGENLLNGDPKGGVRFRGSGHCTDCDEGCSIVGLGLEPVGRGPALEWSEDRKRRFLKGRQLDRRLGLLKTGFDAPVMLFVKRADDADHPFTVAVDLDGTLAKKEEPFDPDSIGAPIESAVAWVRLFHQAGARIIIFTVRGTTKLVRDWLDKHDVPYDFINENPDQPEGASGKVLADVYWDDRAYNAADPHEHGPEILRRVVAHGGEKGKETGDGDPSPAVVIAHQTVLTITGPSLLAALEGQEDDDE